MNYAALQTRVLRRLNMSTTDPAADLVGDYINEALHNIETYAPNGWPWMRTISSITTVAGTNNYAFTTIGTTAYKVLDAKVLLQTNYFQPLTLIGPEEADQNYPATQTSVPEAYYAEASRLYIYPTPDAAYTIKVRAVIAETDLATPTDEPVLPSLFHAAIVEGALMLMYETLQDSTRLAIAQARLQDWIERMKRYGQQYQGVPRIRVREEL